jgi:DNA-directed RNA polymerase subunit RPC12/RpoP
MNTTTDTPTRYCHSAGCSRSTTPHLWDSELCPAPTRTGIEAIECTDCGSLHYVDYDTNAVEIAGEGDPRAAFLDDDQNGFDCLDCGSKVQA